jgi:ligand-binding SRPBCC domain-containing protein
MPFRATWLARITKFAWGSHFCDEQVRGPFALFHHCHRLRPQMQSGAWGTLVTDQIIYALPFGPLGRIGNSIVRQQLERTFAERQERLVRLIANS